MLYMSEYQGTFGAYLRAELATAQSYHARRALGVEAVRGGMDIQAAEARRERSEARRPQVFAQIQADAREFAAVMAERGIQPTHYLRRMVPQTDMARMMGPMGTNVSELQTPVWPITVQRMGGWAAEGYGSFGAYNYTYYAQFTGIAVDADGNLWNYAQRQSYNAGPNEIGPGEAPDLQLRGMLEFAGRAGEHQLAPIDQINPHQDHVEAHPAVRQFRQSLVAVAAQQAELYQ